MDLKLQLLSDAAVGMGICTNHIEILRASRANDDSSKERQAKGKVTDDPAERMVVRLLKFHGRCIRL